MKDKDREGPGLALKIGIAGALTLGAVASGYFLSRRGRRVLREAFEGKRRSRLEDRVLDRLWGDSEVGRCDFDVQETAPGVIVLSGRVTTEEQRSRALEIARGTKDVTQLDDRLEIGPERLTGMLGARR